MAMVNFVILSVRYKSSRINLKSRPLVQDFEPIFEDGFNETVIDSKIKGRVVHEEHNHQVIELSYTLLVMVLWFFLLVYSFQTFIKVLGRVNSKWKSI